MSGNKGFLLLIGGIAVLGVGIGGAFAGGVAVGKTQAAATADDAADIPTPPRSTGGDPTGAGQGSPVFEGGQLTPEQREQFQERFGQEPPEGSSLEASSRAGAARRPSAWAGD